MTPPKAPPAISPKAETEAAAVPARARFRQDKHATLHLACFMPDKKNLPKD